MMVSSTPLPPQYAREIVDPINIRCDMNFFSHRSLSQSWLNLFSRLFLNTFVVTSHIIRVDRDWPTHRGRIRICFFFHFGPMECPGTGFGQRRYRWPYLKRELMPTIELCEIKTIVFSLSCCAYPFRILMRWSFFGCCTRGSRHRWTRLQIMNWKMSTTVIKVIFWMIFWPYEMESGFRSDEIVVKNMNSCFHLVENRICRIARLELWALVRCEIQNSYFVLS